MGCPVKNAVQSTERHRRNRGSQRPTPATTVNIELWSSHGIPPFLLLGLIAGAIAKLILPGKQGGGWIATLVLGVIGALLGGWIGGMLFGEGVDAFFSLSSWLLAIGGSLIVLLIWGFITSRGSKNKA